MDKDWFKILSVTKSFGTLKAVNNFSCYITKGEILGLIGPNGAGKTTLFNIITGFHTPENGRVVFKGSDITGMSPYKIAKIGIARTFQSIRLIRQLSVSWNIMLSFQSQPGEQLLNVLFKWKLSKKWEKLYQKKAIFLLKEFGLEERSKDLAGNLSYGQQKLLSLLCCLSSDADLLLLDEPIAGIAPSMIEKILSIIINLRKEGKSIILIEHNIDIVMQLCDRIIFIDEGSLISEGLPEDVRNDPKVIEAYLD